MRTFVYIVGHMKQQTGNKCYNNNLTKQKRLSNIGADSLVNSAVTLMITVLRYRGESVRDLH